MKTLLCILLLSAAVLGQMTDAQRQGRPEKRRFPGVLLAPSADQTITGAYYLIFQNGTENLKLFPGFHENHSAFAIGADFYTHADAGFRAPYINFYKSRGTQEAPTAVTFTGYELDSIGGINFGGWDGTAYFSGSAAIYTQSDEDWTPTNHGGHLSIYGTSIGGGNTKQIIQFGGKDPNGVASPDGSIISYRPLAFFGNNPSYPALYPSASPPVVHVRTADDGGDAALTVGSLVVTTPYTPAAAFDACVAGTIAWDANFLYVCVATDTWRRSALAAW